MTSSISSLPAIDVTMGGHINTNELTTMAGNAMESAHKDGLRKRTMSTEWSGSSMTELMNMSIRCAKGEVNTPWPSVKEIVNDGLRQCDNIGMFGQVASNNLAVMSERVHELNEDISEIEAKVANEEIEVGRLRKLVECERSIVDQRKQLEGICSVLLQLPSKESLLDTMKQLDMECDRIDAEFDALQNHSDVLAKELNLLLHCSQSVERAANQLNGRQTGDDDRLVGGRVGHDAVDSAKSKAMDKDVMDTST